jgi:GT2 family glycosyltransferase
VVSHDQDDLVNQLLASLARQCPADRVVVTVTRNTKAALPLVSSPFPVQVLSNPCPRGFGANHNRAFATCREPFFCVLNPDIRFIDDPFPRLLACLEHDEVGVAGPFLRDTQGQVQDNGRSFPTPGRIARRLLTRSEHDAIFKPSRQGYVVSDWIAGMFMIFRACDYQKIGGFDQRYFLYCEDADICMRLRRLGLLTCRHPRAWAIHDPARQSHRHWRYLVWHTSSLVRFWHRFFLNR